MEITILGISDEVTECGCCGKSGLKCTVALEIDGSEPVFYGRDCAGMVVKGKKTPKHTREVESLARTASMIAALQARRAAHLLTPAGIEEARVNAEKEAKFQAWLATHPGGTLVDYFNARDQAA